MEAVRYWILTTPRYRWIMVTPIVVGTDERVKRVHRLHISLAAQRPSMPLCGQFHAGDYHPWPLRKTTAVAAEDACVECVRTLLSQDKVAISQANRMLLLQGTITELPPTPALPAPVIEEMQSLALLVQQQQQVIQQQTIVTQQMVVHFLTILQQFGVAPPDALQTLAPLSPSVPVVPATPTFPDLAALLSYEHYRNWLAVHPTNAYIVAPSTNTSSRLIVHTVACTYVTHQAKSSYLYRFGVLDTKIIADAFGREPDYCGDYLSGQAPRENNMPRLLSAQDHE